MGRAAVIIPHNAIAGVKGEDAVKFDIYQDDVDRCTPVTHCWTPSGHIIIGCEKGQLLKVFNVKIRFLLNLRNLS